MLSLEALNPPQRAAVLHEGGPLVVFAGAGSGKTRVITHRVAHLIAQHDVAPWRILAVTFTNKAAGEMKERARQLLGPGADGVQVGTFHSICARLLRRHADRVGISSSFTIYDQDDQQALVRRVLRDLSLDDKRFPPKRVAGRINEAKRELLNPDEIDTGDAWSEIVQKVYREYEDRLRRAEALDFGDLIYRMVKVLEQDHALQVELSERFRHVLVDEFQDTNRAQFRLVSLFSSAHQNLCVVGDDDQSIYRWRGADRRNILDFREAFPDATLIKLEQNYRSTKRILRAAHAVIERNQDREEKELWTDNPSGDPVLIVGASNERDEARLVVGGLQELLVQGRALSDVAVFYRVHAQSRVLEEALRSANLGYRIVGGMRFYDRAEVKDALAYLRLILNPQDDVSLLRIINTPTRGIGKTTIGRLLDFALAHGLGAWDALVEVLSRGEFTPATTKRLRVFFQLIEGLRTKLAAGAPLNELGVEVLERVGYLETLKTEDSPEADARLQNLQELVGSMEQFSTENPDSTLSDYLENVSLQTSEDEEAEGDRVTLMTVHAAKGLEFPIVMATGMEERMFPFKGLDPWDDPDELEEERRLAYVAFTRAKERLVLSYAATRSVFGQQRVGIPSRFLQELPQEDVHWVGSPEAVHGRRGARNSTRSTSGSTDSYIDYTEGTDLSLRLGMMVRHPKFGVGEVRDVQDGTPPRVSVQFPGWGTRKIVATYLEPA